MAGHGQRGQQGNHQNTPSPQQNFYLAVTRHMSEVNNALQRQGEMVGNLQNQISSVQGQHNDFLFRFSQIEKRYDELHLYTRYLEDNCLELDVIIACSQG